MKKPTLIPIAILAAGVAWSQSPASETVAPDTPSSVPAAELTADEHELLVALKGAAPFAARAQTAPEAAGDLCAGIEALDRLLAKASRIQTAETSGLLLDLMSSPEVAVRITALQWLVGRSDVAVPALAMGLQDKHELVRAVAAQLLLDRDVSEETLQSLRDAAEEDPVTLEQMLRAAVHFE